MLLPQSMGATKSHKKHKGLRTDLYLWCFFVAAVLYCFFAAPPPNNLRKKRTMIGFYDFSCLVPFAPLCGYLMEELFEDIEQLANIPDAQLISALQSDIQPARLQCALLPLQALREGLKNYKRQE